MYGKPRHVDDHWDAGQVEVRGDAPPIVAKDVQRKKFHAAAPQSCHGYNNFWLGYEGDYDRTSCPVVARCVRPFLHVDGRRSETYLIEWEGRYFPIKHSTLLTCLTAPQRAAMTRA